jgi:NADPH:quinone reductase-like Zn-dependent oxidoreductase
VCSGGNLALVTSIGADEVIDYTNVDFTKNGQRYDIIMDTAGTAPFARCGSSLEHDGRLLLVLGDLPAMLNAPWVALTTRKRVIAGPASERVEDLRLLAQLADAGQLKPVIDRHFPFAQIREAHRLVDSGRKKGSVVVTLLPEDAD